MVKRLLAQGGQRQFGWRTVWEFLLSEPTLVFTVCLMILMRFLSPYFLTVHNLLNVVRQASIIGIVACGVSWMLISGKFDLSVGSIVSLTCVTMIGMLANGAGTLEVVVVGLLVGVAAGVINGLLVAWLKANPMIITLGTMTVFQGLAFFVGGGYWAKMPNGSPFWWIGNGKVGVLAVPSLLFLGLGLIMHLILSETPFGRRVYALGGNERAATLVGLKVTKYRIILYMVTGVTSAIASMVVSSRAGAGSHFIGLGFEFDAITASVLGGVYLFGGKGSVARAVLGAILLALLSNAQTILGIPTRTQLVVQGVVLLAMVGVQVWGQKRGK